MRKHEKELGFLSFVVMLIGLGIGLWLIKLAASVLLGWLFSLAFGFSWLISSIAVFIGISFVFATIDLFESEKQKKTGGPCPFCGEKLRTPKAKQCGSCKRSWHNDPDLPVSAGDNKK